MKRNTMLTVVMMLGSVAAAVAAPETPSAMVFNDCAEPQQLVVASNAKAMPARNSVITVATSKPAAPTAKDCDNDITEPYRRLHHGGLKLPAGCAAST